MEMLIITLVVMIAFAAVLIPLFRRGTSAADEQEFDTTDAPVDDVSAVSIPPMAAGPATPTVDTTDHPQQYDEDELELEVQRYRTAVRAGTVCRKCGQANPADSAFCFECGARLAGPDAKEFE